MSHCCAELVLEIVAAPIQYDETGRIGHIAALILDEIRTLDARPLHIAIPRDKRLRTVCAALLHEPGRPEALEEWSDIAGPALARLFASETGMRFVDWRDQARLADNAFTALCRKALGKTPRDYFTHSIG